MKKFSIYFLSFFILISIFFRFYKLGQIPSGITWDEAAIGYNGFAIFTTRRDEWLNRLPSSFKSFGDYKAPVAIYLNALSYPILGLSPFSVRFSFTLLAISTIIPLFFLLKEIFPQKNHQLVTILFIIFSLLLAPWHFHYSRIGFESLMAVSFFIYFLYFASIFIKQKKINFKYFVLLFLTSSFASLCFYTYHSSKIFLPLFLLLGFSFFHRQINFKKWFFFSILLIILTLPIIKDSLFGQGLSRSSTLFIFNQEMTAVEKTGLFLRNFSAHFDPFYLAFGKTTTIRHSPGFYGVISYTSCLLLLWALLIFLDKKNNYKFLAISKFNKFIIFSYLLAIIPASLGYEVPHSNRALFSLLFLQYFVFLAGKFIYQHYSSKKKTIKISLIRNITENWVKFIFFITLLQAIEFSGFMIYYFKNYAKLASLEFNDTYLEAVKIARDYEKGINGKREVQTIVFTPDYKEPYIFILFAGKINPIDYQNGALIKYEFKDEITDADLNRTNTLIVASKNDEIDENKAMQKLYDVNGNLTFKIYLTKFTDELANQE